MTSEGAPGRAVTWVVTSDPAPGPRSTAATTLGAVSHIFARYASDVPPVAVGGEGCYMVDAEGKRYLDASAGPAVSCLGHGDPEVLAALHRQLDRLAFAYSGFFTTEPAERLAELITTHAPGDLDRMFYVSSGSEAIEAAIKLARQYFIERGRPERNRIIARRQSYHGNTLGALAAGGNVLRRQPYGPLLVEGSHISPCYEYRHRDIGESSHDFGRRVAQELEDEILRLGPETVMAFLAEPVVGATLGAVPAVDGYFIRIREICDRYGVLLILDEVMCGMGRTGYLFACEHDRIAPDIMCLAKGLGGGYQPLGAMLCTDHLYRTITDGSGVFVHGHTYQAHPMGAAAGLAVVTALLERGLVDRVAAMADGLETRLRDRLGDHPHVGDIRGRGFFWGVEFVAERATKEPFDPVLTVSDRLRATALDNGLMCYPTRGAADGVRGDHVILAPPFIITDSELDEAVDLLARSIDQVLNTATVRQ